MKDAALRKCPKCGKQKLERLIGTGGAIIFKGSGFYQTDYRNESYKKAAEADKPKESKPESAPAAESKPAKAEPAKPAADAKKKSAKKGA